MASSFNYGRMAKIGKRLITKFGRLATLTVVDRPANADKPWEGAVAVQNTITTKMVFLNYTQLQYENQRDEEGTLIKTGDKKVLMFALGQTLAPTVDAFIADNTDLWNVLGVKPLNPGDTMLIYTLHCRQ